MLHPTRKTLSHPSCHPSVTVSREISLQKQIALHRGVAVTLTPIALHCAAKPCPSMPFLRKILVSVKFVPAILGPEMAAPILWTPGKMPSFCRKNHVRKIPLFWGGGVGGGECRFYFYGRADFSDFLTRLPPNNNW